jgi:predicted DNA-binding transcriptional regulator AlpA
MTSKHLTAREVADELGRSTDWLYRNWKTLVGQGMPAPITEGSMLAWSRAQFYAWADRDLPQDLKGATAAYRAALDAYASPSTEPEHVGAWRDRLHRQFASKS